MTVSAISHYRGGTIDVVAPVAKKLKVAYLQHGVAYRLSRFQTGPNVGDWSSLCSTPTRRLTRKRRPPLRKTPNANRPLPRLQSSRRGLAEKWSLISIFDTGGFAVLVRLAFASDRRGGSADVSNVLSPVLKLPFGCVL